MQIEYATDLVFRKRQNLQPLYEPLVRTVIHAVKAENAANRRHLEFLSALDLPGVGIRRVEKMARPLRQDDGNYPGFHLFPGHDLHLFTALVRGEFTVSRFRNRHLPPLLDKTGGQVSRLLKRLRLHGIVKKMGRTYKYYLTTLGQAVTACALRLCETVVLPALATLRPT